MEGTGKSNRPDHESPLSLFFRRGGGGGGRADLRGYCDRWRAQATTDEYIL